jgi:hypothetical protein
MSFLNRSIENFTLFFEDTPEEKNGQGGLLKSLSRF